MTKPSLPLFCLFPSAARRAGVVLVVLAILGATEAQAATPSCAAVGETAISGEALSRTRAALAGGGEVRIIALGSSSTSGVGASSPAKSYPAVLQRRLAELFAKARFRIENRGIGGEDVRAMLGRLDRDVISVRPHLVVWQVGTNAALRRMKLDDFHRQLDQGVDRLKSAGADVVLMNPQYAPAVLKLPDEESYVAVMADSAATKKVGLFPRFEIMRAWHEKERLPFARFITEDGLHLNDFGYACTGELLAEAIIRAAR